MTDDGPPMTRPSVPEADQLIGVKLPVLSHGFVALVDYMGNDAAIVQAARVSYGAGTKSIRDDRGLIRYLMRHRHTTPFEMVELKVLARLPIYVARQWIRHRTACLAEGTRLIFDLPKGPRKGRRCAYPLRIEEVWRKFQPTRNCIPSRQKNPYFRRDRVQGMLLRQLDEETHTFGHTRVLNVVRNGPRPVFRMTLADGKSIECTADHRFLFPDGWKSLSDATGLHEESGRAVWERGEFQLLVNGTQRLFPALYYDREWLEREFVQRKRSVRDIAEACGVDPKTIHHWIRKFGLPLRPEARFMFMPGNAFGRMGGRPRGLTAPRRVLGDGTELYRSKEWLKARWVDDGFSAQRIADLCGCSLAVVRKWLRRFELTHHPGHSSDVRWKRGRVPWNKGRTYRLGHQQWSPQRLATLRAARAGPASNFWKGGTSSDREGIGRWTTQMARTIHERNHWTCQLCHERRMVLHAHHVVPVWADLSRARDPANLTTLCDACHRRVHRDERSYVELLGGPPVEGVWLKRPRVAWNRLTVARSVSIESFEYLGDRTTYDVEVDGSFHNFVANGIVTHNSVNEYSARYSIVPDEYDLPAPEEVRRQSARNRQGRAEVLPEEVSTRFRDDLDRVSKDAYAAYTRALDEGVARETARLLLPVSFYTQWYWKTNLYNLFHFLSLRLDPHAQEEIRLYAAELAKIAKAVCPVAFEAFEEFQLESLGLSRKEQRAVQLLLSGASPEKACEGAGLPLFREDGKPMTSGEGVEFLEKLDRIRSLG